MQIVQLEQKELIGLRVQCGGDQYVHEIPKAAAALRARVAEIEGAIRPDRFIGAYVPGDCPDEQDGYWICVEVGRLDKLPKGMSSLTIPPQQYAVITHQGSNTGIRGTYEVLHRWIADNGYQRDPSAWHLELSGADSDRIELYDMIKSPA